MHLTSFINKSFLFCGSEDILMVRTESDETERHYFSLGVIKEAEKQKVDQAKHLETSVPVTVKM